MAAETVVAKVAAAKEGAVAVVDVMAAVAAEEERVAVKAAAAMATR